MLPGASQSISNPTSTSRPRAMWCILGPGYFSSIPPCWFDESGPLLVGEWFIYAHLARQGSESEAGVPLIGPPSFRAPYWPSYSFLTRVAISHPRFSIGCRISDKFTYHQAPVSTRPFTPSWLIKLALVSLDRRFAGGPHFSTCFQN